MEEVGSYECDICNSEFAPGQIQFLHLACSHSYCIDCTLHYVQLGGPTRKLTFNHLFCPYRCGCSFQSDPVALTHPALGPIIEAHTCVLDTVNRLAVQRLKRCYAEGKRNSELVDRTEAEMLQLAIDEASYFMCDVCEDIFYMVEECSASGSEVETEYLCPKCKPQFASTTMRLRQISPAISLWKENQHKRESLLLNQATMSSLVFENPESCNSDYNAGEQCAELEVLQSMYPEAVEVLTQPPTGTGQPCAVYLFKIPSTEMLTTTHNSSEVIKYLERCRSQIRIVFKCTAGYPSVAAPLILLQIGDLSLLELNSAVKKALSDRLVSLGLTLASKLT
jgi:hypothetical protein